MPYFSPDLVGRAARALFKTGHSETLAFLTLKGEGVSVSKTVRVMSTERPLASLDALARQPNGFDQLVIDHLNDFSSSNNKGLPTRPGTRGSADDYTFYFPIAEESQYLLRKGHTARSYLYTNLTRERKTSPKNGDKAALTDIFGFSDDGEGGVLVNLKEGYEYKALWYYGPATGKTLTIPLQHFAVWYFRSTELDAGITVDKLVSRLIDALHLTSAELELLFYDVPLNVDETSLVDEFTLSDYFSALCIPGNQASIPDIQVIAHHTDLTEEKWRFHAQVMGYDAPDRDPKQVAESLIADGERSLLLLGPPRTGKSHLAMEIAADYLGVRTEDLSKDSRFQRLQFHPGWSYGNFIRKLVPVVVGESVAFRTQDGQFLEHCISNSNDRSVSLIEELNRASIAEVFGEAFQIVETAYRGQEIRISVPPVPENQPKQMAIPKDMLLLFTANDLDKTTSPIDFALLERLATVRCDTDYAKLRKILVGNQWKDEDAISLISVLKDVQDITGFPIGHANFYGLVPSADLNTWYSARLQPVLKQYLTSYRVADLERVDSLVREWIQRPR